MRPFTVLIGIVLGSAASVSFGLIAALIVFLILAKTSPDLLGNHIRELPQLMRNLAAFSILTAASACSFLGLAKDRPWRIWAHVATLISLSAVVLLYWPRRP